MLTLQQLRVLIAVSEAKSLSGAAHDLGYGLPTIMHHIEALEAELGTELVNRTPRGTTVTAAGEIMLREAISILARLNSATQQIRKLTENGRATMTIGLYPSLGAQLIPKLIVELEKLRELQIEIIEGEPSEVLAMLEDGTINLGLIYEFDADPLPINRSRFFIDELINEPFMVAVGECHPLAEATEIDFAEIRDVPWIMSRSDTEASDRVLRHVCSTQGYSPTALVRTDDITMIHGLVRAGLAFALSTEASFGALEGVRMLPAKQSLGQRRTSVIHNRIETFEAIKPAVRLLKEIVS
ncbi:LysR family transcriptional regulator [Canibacter zhoujuaniae]|uniref:LysR family transcriptional regulator n=1 Tax=Canibacter zhoujuaniae TaxID=2708343 RepID=UPI001424897D|nr:LysR family transcriptional regulator [Canibacter zhoujuaniae]